MSRRRPQAPQFRVLARRPTFWEHALAHVLLVSFCLVALGLAALVAALAFEFCRPLFAGV